MEAIKFDFNNMMTEFIGEQGIKESELTNAKDVAKKAFDFFKANRGTEMMGWADLPYNQDDVVEDILASQFRQFCSFGNRRQRARTYCGVQCALPFALQRPS